MPHLLVLFSGILVDQRMLLPLRRRNYYAATNFVDDSGAADSVRLVAAE
jgi:hypothetical protein